MLNASLLVHLLLAIGTVSLLNVLVDTLNLLKAAVACPLLLVIRPQPVKIILSPSVRPRPGSFLEKKVFHVSVNLSVTKLGLWSLCVPRLAQGAFFPKKSTLQNVFLRSVTLQKLENIGI